MHTWQIFVIIVLAWTTVISLVAAVGSWIENERMRQDPSYIPNKSGIFPKRKNH